MNNIMKELLEMMLPEGKLKKSVQIMNRVDDLRFLIADKLLAIANPELTDTISEEAFDSALNAISAIEKILIDLGEKHPVPRPTLAEIKR